MTASIAHNVLLQSNPSSLLQKVMQYDLPNLSNIPSIKWGRDNEELALFNYNAEMIKRHDNGSTSSCGLFSLS